MKHLLSILLICSIGFTQELTVDGNLNVTGNIQNQTIDSLQQVIILQNQLIFTLQQQIQILQTQVDYLASVQGFTIDCNGVINGGATNDDCGECEGENADMDACGVCFGDNLTCTDCFDIVNGDAVEDCLGECNGNAVVDCANICEGGAELDNCGVCDNNPDNDCGLDDCGVWGGDGSSCLCVDIDGNIYNTVVIGDQEWMAENLKVTHYNNGESINTDLQTECYGEECWYGTSQGAYTVYDNNSSNIEMYGLLYNGWTVIDDRGVCPEDWHVPSYDDWGELRNHIGGTSQGGKLKEAGTFHWLSPNSGATNEYGFNALPGGWINEYSGHSASMGEHAYFYTTDEPLGSSNLNMISMRLYYDSVDLDEYTLNRYAGYSVRCIKD